MAISRVQLKTGVTNNATTLTVTFDSTPTAGNTIVMAYVSTVTTQSITGTNMAFQSITTLGANGVAIGLAVGRVLASPGSAVTITLTASNMIAAVAAEYTGSALLRLDRTVSAIGSSTSPASGATATTGTAVELWVGAIGARGTNQNTISSYTNSFTEVGQTFSTIGTTNNDRTVALTERIVSSTGTANSGATITNNNWGAIVAALEETPASGAVTRGFTFGG